MMHSLTLTAFCQRYAGRMRLSTMSCVLHAIGATIAAAILMSGLVGYQLLRFRYETLQQDYQAAVRLRTQAEAIAADDQQTQAMLVQARAHQQQVHQRVPTLPNEIAFLDQLSAAAQQAGLQIRDYRPGSHSEHPTHHEVELILRAEGSYESLCQFAASLNSLSRMCRIAHLSLSAPPQGKTDMTIELRITLVHGLKAQATI